MVGVPDKGGICFQVPATSTCTAASLCDSDCGSRLTTSTVGTTSPRGGGGVSCNRSDANADADEDAGTYEEGEVREEGDVGEDKEVIGRGGDNTVYAAGGRSRGGGKGRGRGPDKEHSEDQGGTLEG